MRKILISSLLLLVPGYASAIVYFHSNSDGTISVIQPEDLPKCKRIIYRAAAREELPIEQKRALLEDLLKGETVNNLIVLQALLRQNPGYCSYRADNEKLSK